MEEVEEEDKLLRTVALQNAQSILLARQRAEEALRKQSEWLRITMSSIGDAVISTDAEGLVTSLNGVAEALTGWTQAAAVGRPLPEVFHIVNEHTRLPVENPALRALREGMVVGLANHTILIARDGTERPIDDSAAPIREGAATPVGAVLVFRDVTERKRAEETQARLAAIVESSDDAIISKSLDGTILTWNSGAERIFGYTPGEAVGQSITLIIPPERLDEERNILARLCRGERVEHFETERMAKDRRRLDISLTISPIRNVEGRVVGASKVARDVTARKRTEQALRESEERRRQLADNLPSGFIYQILHGPHCSRRFTYVSGGVEVLCGVTPAEVVADPMSLYGLIAEDDQARVRATEEEALRDRRPFDCQFQLRCGGRARWLHCRSAPRDQPGGFVVWDGIAVDITERVKMVEALREADRKKDDFIALLAHELRNPLAPIRNGLQVMRLAAGDQGAVAQARGMMERQLGHMVRLIDDLLDVSRINRNKMELRRTRVVLADVVSSAVETARPIIDAEGHDLIIALPQRPVYLDADLTRLAQVFSNLLTNSAKYTERGGRIWLSAERRGGEVAVAVRDNGIGIPSESLASIFDMFAQVDRPTERSTGGLGIGLALVKGLVEMHGGKVTAESGGQGQGSTFTVTLPALTAQAEPEPVAGSGNGQAVAGPSRRILVVDDNRDGADSLAMLLRLLGHEVRTAHDGVEAVETAEAFRPQLVLMDVGMPRLDGYEATRRIREQTWSQAVTIIALTGWGQEGDRMRSQEAGCDGHLVKPVDLSALETILVGLGAS
jgi:PAS domain S-box-containing protein